MRWPWENGKLHEFFIIFPGNERLNKRKRPFSNYFGENIHITEKNIIGPLSEMLGHFLRIVKTEANYNFTHLGEIYILFVAKYILGLFILITVEYLS